MAKGLDPSRPHYQLVMIKGVSSGQVLVHKVERQGHGSPEHARAQLSDAWQMKATAQRRALKKIRRTAFASSARRPRAHPRADLAPEPTPEPNPRTMTRLLPFRC